MKKNFFVTSAVVLGAALAHAQGQAPAPAAGPVPTKIAIINIQNAILSTKDGQTAAGALQAKFAPKKADLDKKQSEIAALRDQLSKGSATMSQDAKDRLMRDIDTNTKAFNRDTEDAQADLDAEQGKIMQDLGGKIMSVVEKYATQNGYAVVMDVSSPQTPVLWAATAIDITQDIIKLYDQAYPGGGSSAAAPAARPPAAAPGAVAPAPAPAPKKK